jgi:CrcB protein
MFQKILFLGLAGAAGTLARYGLAGFVQRSVAGEFPWGTAVVNIVGCFMAGFLWSVFEHHIAVSGQTRVIILIGFMGAFTTFSAFMLETGMLARDAEWFRAIGNIVLQNTAGAVALITGLTIGRLF